MDFDLVRSCYHPDAIDRHGAYEGDIEGFIKWAADLLPTFESTMHFTGNQYVQVEGDVGMPNIMPARFTGRDRMATSPRLTMS